MNTVLNEEQLREYIERAIREELNEGAFRSLMTRLGKTGLGNKVGKYLRALGGNKKGIATAQKGLDAAQKKLTTLSRKGDKFAQDIAKYSNGKELSPEQLAKLKGAPLKSYNNRMANLTAAQKGQKANANLIKGANTNIANFKGDIDSLQKAARRAQVGTVAGGGAALAGGALALNKGNNNADQMQQQYGDDYWAQHASFYNNLMAENVEEGTDEILGLSRAERNAKWGYEWNPTLSAQQNRRNRNVNKALIKQQGYKNHDEYQAGEGHAFGQQPQQQAQAAPTEYPYKADRQKTAQFQTWFNQNFGGNLVVDGIWGKNTEAAYQQWAAQQGQGQMNESRRINEERFKQLVKETITELLTK